MTTVVRVLRRLSPWGPAEGVRALALALAGTVGIVVGWVGAADEPAFGDQVGWLNVALAGFGVGALGAASWVLRARGALRDRRAALLGAGAVAGPRAGAADVERDGIGPAADGRARVVAHPRTGRYHRASCPLAAGRGWPAHDPARLVRRGRLPCGVCRP